MIHLGKDTRDSNNESKSSQPIRKGAEVDKFGFYHAAAPASASMQHDGTFYFLNCVVFHHNFPFYLICYFNFNLHFVNLVLREHRRARRELKQGKHGIRKTKGSFHLIPVVD